MEEKTIKWLFLTLGIPFVLGLNWETQSLSENTLDCTGDKVWQVEECLQHANVPISKNNKFTRLYIFIQQYYLNNPGDEIFFAKLYRKDPRTQRIFHSLSTIEKLRFLKGFSKAVKIISSMTEKSEVDDNDSPPPTLSAEPNSSNKRHKIVKPPAGEIKELEEQLGIRRTESTK